MNEIYLNQLSMVVEIERVEIEIYELQRQRMMTETHNVACYSDERIQVETL